VNVLFVMRHPGVASLAPSLRMLAEGGHHIRLGHMRVRRDESLATVQELEDAYPNITTVELPTTTSLGWAEIAESLRRTGNYLRFLEPPFRDAPKLRKRAQAYAPPRAVRIAGVFAAAGPIGVSVLGGIVETVERCILPPEEVEGFLREQRPDVLIVSHLLALDGGESDYVRAARKLGIRTVFPIRGWDNLTNKGLIRDAPDRVLVWNDLQGREAHELHGVPDGQIRITGAPKCDALFAWHPRRSREEFCRVVGLRSDRPIVLYVGSSPFIAKHEVAFVTEWIADLRARGGELGEAGILVRPHPLNGAQWVSATLDGEQVSVWPRAGESPRDDASRDNYFDSIHHAAAVVGINTTAQIESAILGRPVHTLLAKKFRKTQEGTLHFRHLRAEGYGHVIVGRTPEEHVLQLEASLRGEFDRSRDERFLRRFVRPLGLDVVASTVVVDEIEALAASPAPAPRSGPLLAPLVRLALRPAVGRAARTRARRERRRIEKQEAREQAAAELP
jgi:hypothetical protein